MIFGRKSSLNSQVARRFAVVLARNEGTFAGTLTGILVGTDNEMWVFEDCSTVPKTSGEAIAPIAGRVLVDRAHVSYLQEVTT